MDLYGEYRLKTHMWLVDVDDDCEDDDDDEDDDDNDDDDC